uniref:Uncharacterized protein n=1 Tax=Octopus bimaculoides TaxID=37653 RepID=A0A0L8FKE5_OCTBM
MLFYFRFCFSFPIRFIQRLIHIKKTFNVNIKNRFLLNVLRVCSKEIPHLRQAKITLAFSVIAIPSLNHIASCLYFLVIFILLSDRS